jgi:hypothetical protein
VQVSRSWKGRIASVTLITTIISNYGLIQASDSNVTRVDSATATSDPKVFRLPFTDAALALAGTYRVGNERMDTWMPRCIETYAEESADSSLEGFAHHLKDCLDQELTDGQRSFPTLIHIVGYIADGNGIHPVLYFVRNAGSMNNQTGAYEQIAPTFQVSEDFWARNYRDSQDQGTVDPSRYQSYFNGTPDGRIAFFHFGQLFNTFLHAVWNQPTWKFRPPQSLDELATVVDLQIRTIGILFGMSDYHAPLIGGDPQIEMIPPPTGAVALWSAKGPGASG